MARRPSFAVRILTAGVLITGCNAVDIGTEQGRPDGGIVCLHEPIQGGVRVLTCAEAVQAAEASLGLHWPISDVTFTRDGPIVRDCGALDRCGGRHRSGLVIFEFWLGDTVTVRISLDGNDVPVLVDEEQIPRTH